MEQKDQIHISGSKIDWYKRKILHFNMGMGKIKGIFDTLNIPYECLCKYTGSCYADDPLGKDKDIVSIADKAYIIKNDKNKNE